MGFAAHLRETRHSMRLTQEQFAREVGVSTGTVYRWEAGKSEPSSAAVWRRIGVVAKRAAAQEEAEYQDFVGDLIHNATEKP